MITVMDMSKPHKIIREVTSNLEEEDETTAKEREGIETAVLTKLTIPCLEQVKDAIRNNMSVCLCVCVCLFYPLWSCLFHTGSREICGRVYLYSSQELPSLGNKQFKEWLHL